MPDPVATTEVKADVTPAVVPGPAPAIDPVAFAKMVRDEVQQFMSTEGKDTSNLGYASPSVPPIATENPLKAIVEPIVGPAINRARLEGIGARSAAIFFATHPEAVKYANELNRAFDVGMSQGTPYDYDTLWAWFRGRPENFDKFVNERIDVEKAKVAAAKEAGSVEGSTRAGSPGIVDVESMSQEELTKALKDVTF